MREIQAKAQLYEMLCRLHAADILTEDEAKSHAKEFEEKGSVEIKLGGGSSKEEMRQLLGKIGMTPQWEKEKSDE